MSSSTTDFRRHRLVGFVVLLFAVVGLSFESASPVAAHGANQNGCTFSPDSSWYSGYIQPFLPLIWGYNFHNACDQHDLCYARPHRYGDSEAGRQRCDDEFYWAMRRSCDASYGSWDPRRYTCANTASVYYGAVRVAGWWWYIDWNTRL